MDMINVEAVNDDTDFSFSVKKSWPFKSMEIGEKVIIPAKDAKAAKKYIHPFAHRAGKKFTTQTNPINGNYHVRRDK